MPCSIQPGRLLHQMRMRYTTCRKLGLLTAVEHLQHEEGLTLQRAAERLFVAHLLIVKWKALQVAGDDPFVALICTSKNKKAAHAGQLGQLKAIKEPLLRHIFELREQGVTVSKFQMVVRASQLCPMFGAKHFVAWCSAVKQFVCAHSFVYRMGTHLLQHKPDEVEAEAKDYMCLIRPFIIGPHRDWRFIINMDQMLVYFAMSAKQTLETIHVRTSTNDNKRATVVVTITADVTVLPSMVIFKGKQNGRIAKTEFATYPAPHRYCCQDNAWMGKMVMLAWVDNILWPYVETAPDDVIPLLILDSYQCHMMGLVVQKIQELGVEVTHIPGGCTSLCQPIKIGFNKLFKDRL
jgi:hypothetical protein